MRKNDLQDLARSSKMNFRQDLARMIVGRIEQDLARSYFLVKEKSPKKTSKKALKIGLNFSTHSKNFTTHSKNSTTHFTFQHIF
jgi:hypothetical protein